MKNIIKYLKDYWFICVLAVALLFLQAYCDLSLPDYTSKIVDTGIQNGGVSSAAPEVISRDTLSNMEIFLKDSEIEFIKKYYKESDDLSDAGLELAEGKSSSGDFYILDTDDENTLEALDETFSKAIIMTSALNGMDRETFMAQVQAGSQTEEEYDLSQLSPQQLEAMNRIQKMTDSDENFDAVELLKIELEAGLIEKEDLIKMRNSIVEGYGDDMVSSMAISAVKEEYNRLGIDLDALQYSYLFKNGAIMLVFAFIMMATSILVGFLASKVAAGLGRDLRGRVFKKVVSFSNSEMDRFSTASLITRNTNDIQQVQMVVVMILRMVAYAPIVGVWGVIKVLQTNASMTWIIGIAVLAVLCLVIILMNIAMPKFKMMQTLVDRLNLVAREILTGLPVIRAFSRESYEEDRFDTANRNLTRTQLFTNRVMTFMMPAMTLIMNGVTVLIIWISAKNIDAGTLGVGQMTAFITYTMQIVMSFLMLTMVSVMLPRASVSANRIEEVLATEPIVKDKRNSTMRKITNGEVRFNHVSFKYPDADEYVLEDIDFVAKPGETTAFIGSTGSGKTTLINLIPRFYDVTDGEITIDGIDIRDLKQHDLRSEIGYVPQKGVLFSGTIASNLRYGNENASDEQIKKAAKIAQAYDFIEEKPEKYNDEIAQGGTNVSGGQKQRLSIARAIAKDPKIYIFDDSFSALDFKTDAALRKELSKNVSDSTVLIVAQRISTVLNAEQIIVLDEGRMVGKGTHKELMENCGIYRQIALSQLSQNELEGSGGKEAE